MTNSLQEVFATLIESLRSKLELARELCETEREALAQAWEGSTAGPAVWEVVAPGKFEEAREAAQAKRLEVSR